MQHARDLTQLTPDLWVAQSRLFAMNSGVWVRDGHACLIDPGLTPAEVAALAAAVAAQGWRVDRLILTHSHWDHILGPERWPGVPVLAQAEFTAALHETAPRTQRVIAEMETKEGVQREGEFPLPQPDATFADTLDVTLGSLTLRLTHAPGHAPDQLTVYDPATGTLWAADMLSDLEIPFVSHNLRAYQATLARLAGWEIAALVPGHGTPTTDRAAIAARLADDRAYLDDLAGRVRGVIAAGGSLAAAQAACADMRFRHPADNAEPHQMNVEGAYAELGGPADPAQVGWSNEE
jgi:glyoxylase-like metal-dependent hydrolase (beta-lactamase superfamily II)